MKARILLSLACVSAAYGVDAANGPQCDENVAIPVSASALNLDVPSSFSLSSLNTSDITGLLKSFPTTTVTGDYIIAGRYCEPAKPVADRHQTLQILPNGLLVCQVPFNAETLHGVIEAARAGQIGGRQFQKIIWVGHSEGSLIGDSLAQRYPDDVDIYIQTGWIPFLIIGGFGLIAAGGYIPAVLADTVKFAGVTDLTYLAGTNKGGVEGNFYAGPYSHQVADYAFANRGTVTTGEFLTVFLGELPAPGYKGPLLAMNGERDQAFCARLPTDPLVGYRGDCGEGSLSYTALDQTLFPNAAPFEYVNLDDTGHNIGLHYTAQRNFIAHDFLAAQGY
ncbi:hypothetical protein PRZ48_013719 [Zasmidium cellare]|uniref:Uncharacterized protein n=1 Tax=Zasmidium cellare TaxID=395010 RepID=A0ABR0E2M2_ZASCE|nr:hypothetical protein PRZ48_013719 [Zasmidium cellare]